MNKQELIDAVASATGSKAVAGEAIGAVIEAICSAVVNGDTVHWVGFGSFGLGMRAARNGRNPSTGQVINIPAAKKTKFAAGKAFKSRGKPYQPLSAELQSPERPHECRHSTRM